MKFKEGIILTQNRDEQLLIPVGKAASAFSGMIKMNGTAAFIAKELQHETDTAQIVAALMNEYEVTEEKATDCVTRLVQQFREKGLLEE